MRTNTPLSDRFPAWVYAGLLLGLVTVLTMSSLAPGAEPGRTEESGRALLDQATQAHGRHDIALEESLLNRARSTADVSSVCEALRRLARLDWKFRRRYEAADRRLDEAEALGDAAVETLVERALLAIETNRFAEARAAANQALQAAATITDERRAQTLHARATVKEVVGARLDGGGPVDLKAVRESFERLEPVVRQEPGDLELARNLLSLALVLRDWSAVRLAWRAYFHVADNALIPNLVSRAGKVVDSVAGSSVAGRPLSRENWRGLVGALAASRFFREAAILAMEPDGTASGASEVREIVAYARFCRRIRSITTEHYRRTALGTPAQGEYLNQLAAAAQSLWPDLQSPRPEHPKASESSLEETLSDTLGSRFGAYFSLGPTAGYYDLHMGHAVEDVTRTIEQYGREVQLRLVVLDSMVSNGFQSWAWRDGQHGGWNKPGLIYQVRPAYASGPLTAWRQVAEESDRSELLAEIGRESRSDETRDPTGFLPGLRMRLLHQGRQQLLDRLGRRGLKGAALRMAFLAEYRQAVLESSIFAHEGRHAIDKSSWLSFLSRDEAREFNAKLSEVAFAPEPRLALGAIFSETIGSHTPHGQANSRIMKGLARWMEHHSEDIPGLDVSRPLLPQFDLLTDSRIREAFRSLDSMAKGH